MYSFKDDYSEGLHPTILEAMAKSNLDQEPGYGMDTYCKQAKDKLKIRLETDQVDIHFVSAGTQANLLAIAACLRPHEACISAETGHIVSHETGAIEASGHKVLTLKTRDGKLSPELIHPLLDQFHQENSVKPRLVYISNPTELGTLYNKDDLADLYAYCQTNDLLLYMDGARLSSALAVPEAGLSLAAIQKYTDAFFLGGTKAGALMGEALVLSAPAFKKDFRYIMKQRGAILAKGRFLGIQFDCLLEDDLFLTLAKHANRLANQVQSALKARGIPFLVETKTNQLFPIIDKQTLEALRQDFDFHQWSQIDDDHICIRLVFSWATPEEEALKLIDFFTTYQAS